MKRRKTKDRGAPARDTETPEARTPREHGDAYDDVQERDDGLVATSSTHRTPSDRRPEEPSDAAVTGVPVDKP